MIKSLSDLEYRLTDGGMTKLVEKKGIDQNIDNNQEGKSSAGLASYIQKNHLCTECHKPLVLSRGKSGKAILWCKYCKKTYLLEVRDINHYIQSNHISCPKDGNAIEGKLGNYGVYIRCDAGHILKPEEI